METFALRPFNGDARRAASGDVFTPAVEVRGGQTRSRPYGLVAPRVPGDVAAVRVAGRPRGGVVGAAIAPEDMDGTAGAEAAAAGGQRAAFCCAVAN
jgi:hypothetical protein